MGERDRAAYEGEELKAANLRVGAAPAGGGCAGAGNNCRLAGAALGASNNCRLVGAALGGHCSVEGRQCVCRWVCPHCACTARDARAARAAARPRALQLEQQLREVSSRAETESLQRVELERQAAELRAQLAAALLKAAEAEALPGLRQELEAAQAQAARLGQRERQLEQEGQELRRQLGAATAASEAAAAEAKERQRATDELAAAHAVVQQQLREEVAELKVGRDWGGGGMRASARLNSLLNLCSRAPCPGPPANRCAAPHRASHQGHVGQLEERLQAAQQEAEAARSAQQAAEAAAAELRGRQEGDVQALVQHHAEEVGGGTRGGWQGGAPARAALLSYRR